MKDIDLYSADQIVELVKSLSPSDLQTDISRMTPEQVSAAVAAIHPFSDPLWREKLAAVYLGLDQRQQLETAGKSLTYVQGLVFLDIASENDSAHHWKLPPLLVGMTHETFINLLIKSDEKQYLMLQQEALTEAVQHHLTLIGHDLVKQEQSCHQKIDLIRTEIFSLDPASLNTIAIRSLLDRIETLRDDYYRFVDVNNRALRLAWNTDRPDIIDTLNSTKESLSKVLTKEIGHPRHEMIPASGIYALFDKHLNVVYGDAEDISDIEALHNDEPAIEAMTKLSIWYLKDYWKLGLLPRIASEKELRIDPTAYSEKECREHREMLMKEIRENLASIGLKSVADFKSAQIYSKEMLQDYVEQKKSLIS